MTKDEILKELLKDCTWDLVKLKKLLVNDKHGTTPLHDAVEKGHIEVVKFLLDYGADVNAKDKYGCTPLDTAVWSEPREMIPLCKMISLLKNHGAK